MVETTDKEQKTEEPTDKRLNDAREKGEISTSREVATWFMFVSFLIVVTWLGLPFGKQLSSTLRVFLEKPHELHVDSGGMQDVLLGVIMNIILQAFILYGLLWASSILGTMIQTGFYVNSNKLKFDVSKLMPSSGLKRLFSMNAIVEFLKAFVKMVVLGYVAYIAVKPAFDELAGLVDVPLITSLTFLYDEIIHVIIILMIVITFIAIADLLYSRYTYYKNLRMTKQEIKDEYKQLEGDPMIKGRLRRLRIEKARRRMMAKVPKADVVITNPTHFAVALSYDREVMSAPVVVAKGADFLAKKIREIAVEHEVPLISNPPLARALYDTVELDQPIEPQHYRAVAEIISYIFRLKAKK